MRTLKELRAAIDEVDGEIVAALNRRFRLTAEVRELKSTTGLPPIDNAREREIFERAMAATDPAERDTIFGIYERIFSGARGTIETIARGVCCRDGKLLVCRAKGGASAYLPGGHIEFGETGREALVREVREELGRESTAGEFLGVVENKFLQHGKKHAEINLVYELNIADDAPIASQEAWIEFAWVDLAKLDEINLLPNEMRALSAKMR